MSEDLYDLTEQEGDISSEGELNSPAGLSRLPPDERLIKNVDSLCPRCLQAIPAQVFQRNQEVWMRKACSEHGSFELLLDADAQHYIESSSTDGASASGGGACCGSTCAAPAPPGGSEAPAWTQHSCTVLIEIIERCNLTCPTCFAGSSPQHSGLMSMEEFRRQVDGLSTGGKRSADMIQLSGGEPTIHPKILDMVDYLFEQGFAHVTINSNGIKLAQTGFCDRLAARLQKHPDKKLFIYLQFDGFDEETHEALRGRADLLDIKQRAISNCERLKIPLHPVMTLTRGINDHEVGDFIGLTSSYSDLRNLVIQPAMYSGRYENPARADRLTLGDTIALIREQVPIFEDQDFVPIPCSDPNCFRMAVALRTGSGLVPVSRLFPRHEAWDEPGTRELIERFTNTINGTQAIGEAMTWALDSPGSNSPTGASLSADNGNSLAEFLGGLDEKTVDELLDLMLSAQDDPTVIWQHVVMISIKPFMDAWSYDQDRIDQCCVHILDPQGNPVSFCEFNAINRPKLQEANQIAGRAPLTDPLGIRVMS
jgi:uncharacterized radical SAM superfamily Fe-S cluster-containing enzyme